MQKPKKITSDNFNESVIIKAISEIVDAGGNAEVRKNKDGTWNVYEVKKSIKCVG